MMPSEKAIMQGKETKMLLTDYAAGLEADGFAVVPAIIEDGEISALLVAIAARAEAQISSGSGGVYALRGLLDSPVIRAFAASPRLRRLVVPLLGQGAFPVRGAFFDKTPDANWKVNWHQDLTIAVAARRDIPGFGAWSEKAGVVHVQPPPELLARMIAVRVHLDDCPPENGPLRVLAGSHRANRLKDAEIAAWRARTDQTICAVSRGGAMVLRPLLLHASSASEHPGRRRVLHLEYAAEPLPNGLQWRYAPPEIS